MNKTSSLLDDFSRATERLAEALAQAEDEFIRDAAIQRFEFSFELAWKSIQAVAREYGQDCGSPRTAFGTALRNGWIRDEAAWLDMMEARNRTSHTYREALAQQVFAELGGFLSHLRGLANVLHGRHEDAKPNRLEPGSPTPGTPEKGAGLLADRARSRKTP